MVDESWNVQLSNSIFYCFSVMVDTTMDSDSTTHFVLYGSQPNKATMPEAGVGKRVNVSVRLHPPYTLTPLLRLSRMISTEVIS